VIRETVVQAFDHDQANDDTLGSAIMDEDGDFEIIYHERDYVQIDGELRD